MKELLFIWFALFLIGSWLLIVRYFGGFEVAVLVGITMGIVITITNKK